MPVSRAQSLFEKALQDLQHSVSVAAVGYSFEEGIRRGYFEEAIHMLWVATRVQLYNKYLLRRRDESLAQLIRDTISKLEADRFTKDELAEILKKYGAAVADSLSGLRQSVIPTRGRLFELVTEYSLKVLFQGRTTRTGTKVSVVPTKKGQKRAGIDLAIIAEGERAIGLSVKGNVRERLRESVERGEVAVNKGEFVRVWHVVLTSGDDADREELSRVEGDTAYRGIRVYTWTKLCPPAGTSPLGAEVLSLKSLPSDIGEVIQVEPTEL